MKTITNKLVMSVLALVLTGVALSVGVFAWFTVNNTATIESFTGTVETGEGFYVSLDGTNWKNTLTEAEMQEAANASVGVGVTFTALTSSDGMEMFPLGSVTAATSGFIEFDLLFVGSEGLDNVRLTELILSATETSWIPGVYVPGTRQALNDDTTPIVEYVSNAARVSFEDLFTSTASVFEQIEGATTDTNTSGTNGNSLGKQTWTTESPSDLDNEALLFYNAIMPIADQIDLTEFTAVTLPTTNQAGSNLTNDVATLNPTATANPSGISYTVPTAVTNVIGTDYVKGAITVRIWVEGWDGEAFNAILSGVLSTSFRFTGYSVV